MVEVLVEVLKSGFDLLPNLKHLIISLSFRSMCSASFVYFRTNDCADSVGDSGHSFKKITDDARLSCSISSTLFSRWSTDVTTVFNLS